MRTPCIKFLGYLKKLLITQNSIFLKCLYLINIPEKVHKWRTTISNLEPFLMSGYYKFSKTRTFDLNFIVELDYIGSNFYWRTRIDC